MPESSLSLALTDIQARLGNEAGFGWGSVGGYSDPTWTTVQQNILTDATQSGLRRFYYPKPLPGQGASYNWTFLRPTITAGLASGASTVALSDDFGGIEGSVSLISSAGILWGPVQIYNSAEVDQKFAVFPTTTGRPRMASVQWLPGTSATQGQRAQLYVWPLADTAYSLRFQYYLQANYLNGSYPYALGGMAHVETILESCLAVLEERLDGVPEGAGPHGIAFQNRLAASISMDRRSKAQTLGYNGDRSDGFEWRRGDNHTVNSIAINGTTY